MRRPVLLDLFCCQGGAAKGFYDVGFEVVGVDIVDQPRYPFDFFKLDAMMVLRHVAQTQGFDHYRFDAIHASPPCQHDSDCQRLRGREHPDLIEETRELLERTGLPYIIENVRGARGKMRDPVMLCGTMFGMEMYRHRYFETNWGLTAPAHPKHTAPQAKMGRPPKDGEFVSAVGNFSAVQKVRDIMEMPWANRDGLREAIPPAYTRHIGEQLREVIA